MSKKIIIKEDTSCDMLTIELKNESENKCLFHGNYWDFNRDGEEFKRLFEAIGLEVEYIEESCEEGEEE